MPAAVVAVASWVGNAIAVTLGSSAAAAAIGAAAANGIVALGFGAGFGAAISAWATVAAVGSLFVKPKIGSATGGSGAQLNFKADPSAAIPYLIGRTATAGNIVHANTSGPYDKNQHLLFCTVLSGAGPIQEFEGFSANDEAVTFTGEGLGGGQCLTGRFANAMDMRNQLGSQTPAAFPYCTLPDGTLPEWTSANKLTGFAASWWGLNFHQPTYPTGVPKPKWTLKGVLAYDPREDSTYPGGSGSQRANDESTWTFSENPWIHAITWCLGRMQNSLRILGVGAAVASIDMAAFVEAANIADANAWKVGGVVYSSDPKWDVLQAICQAGGGLPMRMGSKLSCFVNAPKVSLGTLTGKDVDGEPSITTTQARRARINRVIPKYRSEAHGWEMVAADPVAVDDYIAQDAGRRSREHEYPLVQDVDQASQLAAYEILNGREFGPLSFPLIPRWMGLQPGDTFVMDEAEFGLSAQKLLVVSRDRDPGTGMRTLICRSETDAKHAFALGLTGVAPPTPGLTAPAAIPAPDAGDFTFVGVTLTGGSASFPAIQIAGTIIDVNVAALDIRYRADGATDWQAWPSIATEGALLTVDIPAVSAGVTYEAEVAYISVRGDSSAWTSLGTAVAGDFTFAELAALLWADPAKNLYRKVDWVAADGAVFRDRVPLGLGVTNGASGWGFRFPAATNDARITVPGKVNGLLSDGDRYAVQFMAFLSSGSGTAQIRAGWRDAGGGTISDLADEIYTVTTTPTRFVWDGFGSNDPDFTTAAFRVFELTGDIAGGQTVDVTDLQMEYGGRASSGWRPSPDDEDLLAYAGYYGDLGATKNSIYGPTGTAPSSPTNGDFWIDNSTTPVVLKQRVAGAWVVGAANGGSFGNNLYHTPGGTLATLSNFLTSSGTAAAITGQGPLATASNPVATLQYLDGNGQFSDWRGFGNPNGAAGMGAVFDVNPLTADNRYCYVAAFNLKGQSYTRACGSATIDFGGPDATYGVVMHWAGGYYGAILVEDIDLYVSAGGWLYLGTVKTSNGGVFTPPTNIYDGYIPDFGGVYGGVVP